MVDIFRFVDENDGDLSANQTLEKIYKAIKSLENYPNRGVHVKELEQTGRLEYREIGFKVYRIFYRVIDNKVYVGFVADGRRNLLEDLLLRLCCE
ncbi:MAG: type II toxin-antitoxin system RelE/ParE family toxin [Planctomycetes bacterium]|nr:type II toxin-antitoxin system RelE/ParE family toxin [Planctomycetota bacterium]